MSIIIPTCRIRGAIFDLDGNLLDSMHVWAQIDVDFLGKRGIPLPDDYMHAIAHLGAQATAEYTIKRFNLTDTPEELIREWDEMACEHYSQRIELKPHAREYLLKLKAQGVSLGVATANDSSLYTPALKRCGVYELFDSFTTITEVSRGKGFPDIYLRAAEKLGLNAGECTVFEDLCQGVKGANDGGFYTVGVYDSASAMEWENLKKLSDTHINDYSLLL